MKHLKMTFGIGMFAAAVGFAAEPVYVNDFTTRTSLNPIPVCGEWMTAQPYTTPVDAGGGRAVIGGHR